MKTWFTSDLHFGHKNVITYCNRPYQTVEEMDDRLIYNWNSSVAPDDVIYIIGDVFFCGKGRAKEILSQLNGRKRLLLGNHDDLIRENADVQAFFEEILPDLAHIFIDGIAVAMCHYPLLTWFKSNKGSFNLHGHCHNSIPFDGIYRRLDVGVDAQDMKPIEWTEIKRRLLKVEIKDARNRSRA